MWHLLNQISCFLPRNNSCCWFTAGWAPERGPHTLKHTHLETLQPLKVSRRLHAARWAPHANARCRGAISGDSIRMHYTLINLWKFDEALVQWRSCFVMISAVSSDWWQSLTHRSVWLMSSSLKVVGEDALEQGTLSASVRAALRRPPEESCWLRALRGKHFTCSQIKNKSQHLDDIFIYFSSTFRIVVFSSRLIWFPAF